MENVKALGQLEKFALVREKLLKEYQRQWELNLIESQNPEWHDLYEKIIL